MRVALVLGGGAAFIAISLFGGYAARRWWGTPDGEVGAGTARDPSEIPDRLSPRKATPLVAEVEPSPTDGDPAGSTVRVGNAQVGEPAARSTSPPRDASDLALRKAATNSMSLKEFFEQTRTKRGSSAQPADLIRPFVGTRFEFAGFVQSVSHQSEDKLAVELGTNADDPPSGRTIRCFFQCEGYNQRLAAAPPRERILVTGILSSTGTLDSCTLLMTMSPPEGAKPRRHPS